MNAPQSPASVAREAVQRQVTTAFGSAACRYDQFAGIQRQCGAQLIRALPRRSWSRVLDLGCGTGFMARQLLTQADVVLGMDVAAPMLMQAAQTGAQPTGWVGADMHQLPLATGTIDLIVSNYALQWSPALTQLLGELARVVPMGGYVAFAVPVDGTLTELRRSWQAVDGECEHVNAFHTVDQWQAALEAAGFEIGMTERRLDREWVGSVAELSRQLRGMGAHRITGNQRNTLTGKSRWRAMCDYYGKQARSDGRLPVSWVSWLVVAERTGY